MKATTDRFFFGAITAAATTLGFSVPALAQTTIAIDGSSTVFPITEAVAEEFQIANSGINVTVGVSGTGGGFEKFCAGETAISNASRPIKEEEIQACEANGIEYIELPIAYDALTVVVNPENTWASEMTVEELNTLWAPEAEGTITTWSQVRSGWPDEPIGFADILALSQDPEGWAAFGHPEWGPFRLGKTNPN
ncbi:MAG: hypothetical protein F6K28_54030, partial [Microcoleus sp. SIO2G3]|nr:hypothetical protein [Microcoleus sp. SIO2G3]